MLTTTSTSSSTNISLPFAIFSPLNSIITDYLSNSSKFNNPIRLAKSLNGIELDAFYRQSSDIPRNPTNVKLLNGILVDKDYTPPTTIATDINISDNDRVINSDGEGWVIIDVATPIKNNSTIIQQQQPKKPPESIFTAVIQSLLNTQTEVLRSEASSSLSEEITAEEEDYYYGEEQEKYEIAKTTTTFASINLSEINSISDSALSLCMSLGFIVFLAQKDYVIVKFLCRLCKSNY